MRNRADRRPGDTFPAPAPWQLQGGPARRWGTVQRHPGGCRFCGDHRAPGGICPAGTCLACGTVQCKNSGECLVCLVGFIDAPPWRAVQGYAQCGYSRCSGPAVARVPRVGRACVAHLRVAKQRGIPLASYIRDALALRDRGGHDWQKLTWFGPAKRYAVRRWHDDGRSGWTTGADPQGFETAGQADREADAWRRPATGWTAERVELTAEVAQQIAERYPVPDPPEYEPPDEEESC